MNAEKKINDPERIGEPLVANMDDDVSARRSLY